MPRRCIFILLFAAVPNPALGEDGTATQGRVDWPQARGDAQNRGTITLSAPETKTLSAFAFEGSSRVWGYRPGLTVWSSPAVSVSEGRAMVVAGSYDHNLYALDAGTGEVIWKFTTGDSISQAPTLWHTKERLWAFVASSDRLVYALDAELGRRVWIHSVATFRPTLGGARLSSPVVGETNGRTAVFVGHWVWDRSLSESMQEGGLTALEAETGKKIWSVVLGDNEITAPIFANVGDARWLFVSSANGNLYALDADTGAVRWQQTELDAVLAPPAFVALSSGGRVVTASKSGLVRCLRAEDGSEIWRYQTGDWVTSSPVIGNVRGRMLAVVGSYDRSVYALELLTGEIVWRHHTPAGVYSAPAFVESGSRPLVIASSWDHHLRGISAVDGALAWEVYTGRPIWNTVGLEHSAWSSPTAALINGVWMAYFGSYDGTLYAFKMAELAARERKGENQGFWFSFPLMLSGVAGVAWVLTRRHRQLLSNRAPSRSEPT